jgi:NAD(P)-dependent dehydrogenase (short-subunit alcohol dehydrogenase family)
MRRRKSNGGGADGKTKGGPLFKVKTEAEKDKEFEDKCEKYCSRAIGLGILGWTMFNFIYSLGDYFFRSGMENIDTNVDLSGKVAVLTGGTSGIGFELAISMALAGAKVYVGAKNATLAESLQVELQARASELNFDVDTDIEKITSFPLRLDRFASVKKFAKQVIVDTKKNGKGVNLLVNNAGTLGGGVACSDTKDGHNLVVQVNYLGPFLLTHLLLPSLKKAEDGGRIVHVTCAEAWNGVIGENYFHGDGPNDEYCRPADVYSRSKLMQVSFSNEIQRRLQGASFVTKSQVSSNAVNPGSTQTNFVHQYGGVPNRRMSFGPWRLIFKLFSYIFGWIPFPRFSLQRPLSHSVMSVFHVATSPDLNGVGGKYFSDRNGPFVGCGVDHASPAGRSCGEGPHPPAATDDVLASKLYSLSKEAVGDYLPAKKKKRKKKKAQKDDGEEE